MNPVERLRAALYGAVQGVGFRPFVYRLATELGLAGWVLNSSSGLVIEVEGDGSRLEKFLERLESERPAAAIVLTMETSVLAPAGFTGFEIRASDPGERRTVGVLADLATCPSCLEELLDPADRRFRYPFTNCTLCGPRYTIVTGLPYDRPRTTMREFELCDACRREYADPSDRRFHAQPTACPRCGPALNMEIREAAATLARGEILALKGIGGFQLLADARRQDTVAALRRRKQREEKPFALMMPSLAMLREYCFVSPGEERLLRSPAAPIVLLRPRGARDLAPNVAAHSPHLGVMLPYSPLHHLLLGEFPFPVVATSGNRGGEPIAIGNQEARERLTGVADVFLTHNRPIARPCDDSVARLSRGRESVLRRARGYAPLPVRVGRELPPVLAVGGHLKNTVAIAAGNQVIVSQHVGDLDTLEARGAFEKAIEDLRRLYDFQPELVACDLHPDYASSQWALASGLPVVRVQHHQAHVASCAAENDVRGAYLGVAWDGAGYGLDGAVWGGEFFLVENGRMERISHLRPFRLPGGEAAIREGWRAAASLLHEIGHPPDSPLLKRMIERGVQAPWTTSVGRLFDAVAAITGVAQESRFEGQAAMMLEMQIGDRQSQESYPLPERDGIADWAMLVEAVVRDTKQGVSASLMALRFHNALIDWMLSVADRTGIKQVALSGGVFQNRYLAERSVERLESRGCRVYTHQRVPANDGGLSLGQAVLAAGD